MFYVRIATHLTSLLRINAIYTRRKDFSLPGFYVTDNAEDALSKPHDAVIVASGRIGFLETMKYLEKRGETILTETSFLTLTDEEFCPICKNKDRNHKIIMVVENTRDLAAYEKTGKFEGVYHVLHGAISPMLGIGPDDIKLKELMVRLQNDVEEVIIATNSSLEGETTAMYISKLIKPTGIKVTRIASGVPVGGDLEYIDEVTLLRALEGRTEL